MSSPWASTSWGDGSAQLPSHLSLACSPVVVEATRGVDRYGSLQKAWIQMRQAGVQRLSLKQLVLSSGSARP